MKNPENNRTTAENAGEFYGLEQEVKTGQQRKSKIFLYQDNRYKFKRQSWEIVISLAIFMCV